MSGFNEFLIKIASIEAQILAKSPKSSQNRPQKAIFEGSKRSELKTVLFILKVLELKNSVLELKSKLELSNSVLELKSKLELSVEN